jgi:mRNA-degrading endonuclease RelE of RelBE toxin-antitoxin system
MTARYTERFLRGYRDAPPVVRKAFQKQVRLLLHNLQHPSLRAKKYDPSRDIWQARVNRNWRFYFLIQGDSYVLLDIMAHPE